MSHLSGGSLSDTDPLDDCASSTATTAADVGGCPCGFASHTVDFASEFPLIIPPGVEPDSFEEKLIHAKAITNPSRWKLLPQRSDSQEEQMVYVGIGKMKRMIMNRLVTPLGSAILDQDKKPITQTSPAETKPSEPNPAEASGADGASGVAGGSDELAKKAKFLKVWIETPVGNKATHASLVGEETFDADGDLGDWTARTFVTNYSCPKFCEGREFRALQMERHNPKFGTAYETKAVLPDKEFGKVLLYNISITPPPDSKHTDKISVTQFYKPEQA